VERLSSEEVRLLPSRTWFQPEGPLDCGNSGTTMRLLSGLIAGRQISATLTGDESLSRRPMSRIAQPLRLMGAEVEGETAPLTIKGHSPLIGIDYRSPVASAQVKSAVLLAGLRALGNTTVREPSLSRDHTERMLSALGVDVKVMCDESHSVATISGSCSFDGFAFHIPADISSAAFFMVAAAIVPSSRLQILDLGMNPTRTGIFDILEQAGVPYTIESASEELNEPLGDVEIWSPDMLTAFSIEGAMVPRLIDEIPALAILATQCDGVSVIRDAQRWELMSTCIRMAWRLAGLVSCLALRLRRVEITALQWPLP
jgi:3-phosphoshikimate 1-carboxyvinyltransferase